VKLFPGVELVLNCAELEISEKFAMFMLKTKIEIKTLFKY
jgi:hypothetical protein